MKARFLFSAMLVVILAFGLVSCSDGGGSSSNGPKLDHVFLVTEQDSRNFNWQNAKESFSAGSGVAFIIYGRNLEFDVNKICMTTKKGSDVVYQDELTINCPAVPDLDPSDYSITWGFGTYQVNQRGDDWSAEVYVIDVMGNKSNSIKKTFKVT